MTTAARAGRARRVCESSTPPALADDISEPALAADMMEAQLAAEPTEKADATDPMEPMDKKLPTEPTLNVELRLAMDRIESSEAMDHFDAMSEG